MAERDGLDALATMLGEFRSAIGPVVVAEQAVRLFSQTYAESHSQELAAQHVWTRPRLSWQMIIQSRQRRLRLLRVCRRIQLTHPSTVAAATRRLSHLTPALKRRPKVTSSLRDDDVS